MHRIRNIEQWSLCNQIKYNIYIIEKGSFHKNRERAWPEAPPERVLAYADVADPPTLRDIVYAY